MIAGKWDAHPNGSRWYGCVIVEPIGGGDTDYFYGYSNYDKRPSWHGLVPTGYRKLEYSVHKIPWRTSK